MFVKVTCEKCGKHFSFDTDGYGVERFWTSTVRAGEESPRVPMFGVNCPHCGEHMLLSSEPPPWDGEKAEGGV